MLICERPLVHRRIRLPASAGCATICILLLSPAFATGWSDYCFDIGDGYEICRTSAGFVSVYFDSMGVAGGGDNVGPVFGYKTTTQHIFVKNFGRTYRNRDLFPRDIIPEVDTSQEFYFIIVKRMEDVTTLEARDSVIYEVPAGVIGPMTKEEFMARPEVAALDSLNWKRPMHPVWSIVLNVLIGFALFVLICVIAFLFRWGLAIRTRRLAPQQAPANSPTPPRS